jgi:acylphosphatase
MSTTEDRRCITVRITGHVQGVGFRDWTVRRAQKLGIEGWVRNQPDGSVKAVIAGGEEAIAAMLHGFMEGLDFATVTDVIWEPAEDEGLSGFNIAP